MPADRLPSNVFSSLQTPLMISVTIFKRFSLPIRIIDNLRHDVVESHSDFACHACRDSTIPVVKMHRNVIFRFIDNQDEIELL